MKENIEKIALSLKNISFSFGQTQVLRDFSLDIEEGGITTLLGPSGCGKTTILRLIAGFLEPASGEILIDGENQNKVAPNLRKVSMVFQDYALFPHLNVEENILYGLKIELKNEKKSERKEKFAERLNFAARILGLDELLARFPHELSGGQQQRVALARALVLNPKILLMDEPLSNLDTKLRGQVREEFKELQQKLHITTVYVTHDQEEAFSLSTKIAVINQGQLLQCDSAREIYFSPANEFVANISGKANFLTLDEKTILVRPEWFSVKEENSMQSSVQNADNVISVSGIVKTTCFLGGTTRYKIACDVTKDKILVADLSNETTDFRDGEKIVLCAKRFVVLHR